MVRVIESFLWTLYILKLSSNISKAKHLDMIPSDWLLWSPSQSLLQRWEYAYKLIYIHCRIFIDLQIDAPVNADTASNIQERATRYVHPNSWTVIYMQTNSHLLLSPFPGVCCRPWHGQHNWINSSLVVPSSVTPDHGSNRRTDRVFHCLRINAS